MSSRAPLVALKDVRLQDGPVQLFDGVNLALESGVRATLVGPNGAGKSTLLRLVAGLIEPDDGAGEPGSQVGGDQPGHGLYLAIHHRESPWSVHGPRKDARAQSLNHGGKGYTAPTASRPTWRPVRVRDLS